MKEFKTSDIQRGYISANVGDLVDCPLWWHRQGLIQTSSGYGGKLTSRYKISLDGKLRRLYHTCYGNAASTWFTLKGEKVHVR
jgi:hypothetical protein